MSCSFGTLGITLSPFLMIWLFEFSFTFLKYLIYLLLQNYGFVVGASPDVSPLYLNIENSYCFGGVLDKPFLSDHLSFSYPLSSPVFTNFILVMYFEIFLLVNMLFILFLSKLHHQICWLVLLVILHFICQCWRVCAHFYFPQLGWVFFRPFILFSKNMSGYCMIPEK